MCGEYGAEDLRTFSITEPPPLVRGIRLSLKADVSVSRSHPHLCGEYQMVIYQYLASVEPPPLVRGIPNIDISPFGFEKLLHFNHFGS